MGEFELIARHFQQPAAQAAAAHGVPLGIGDDCALLQPAAGQQVAISTDLLVEGRHFFADVPPAALGHKALAVNLSDLAAMGAEPLGFTLALALPPERAQNTNWLAAFSQGLLALASQARCPLVGGDTTAGPLAICITVFGQIPAGAALRRNGAQAGDDVWVSGHLGDARLALGALQGHWPLPPAQMACARQRLERPSPRLALGLALRGLASAAIDISDGLAGDLGHILHASGVGACLHAPALHRLMACAWHHAPGAPTRLQLILNGGDDYELAFTAPPHARAAVQHAAWQAGCRVSRIGHIEATCGLRLQTPTETLPLPPKGFDHFAA